MTKIKLREPWMASMLAFAMSILSFIAWATEGEPTYHIKAFQTERTDKVFMGNKSLYPSDDEHVILSVKVNFLKDGGMLRAEEMRGEITQLLLLDSHRKVYKPHNTYSAEVANDANITLYFNIPKDSDGLRLQYREFEPILLEQTRVPES